VRRWYGCFRYRKAPCHAVTRHQRWLVPVVLSVVTATWAIPWPLVGWAGASSGKVIQHAVVLSASADPVIVPASGGDIVVHGRVEHATACALQLLSRQSFPVVYSHNPTTACQDGSFSARVAIGANPGPVKRTIAFSLTALNNRSSFSGRFYVGLAGASRAAVLTMKTSPSYLSPQGGQVTLAATLKHASSCQLKLLSQQSFPVVYASNVRPCTSSFDAHVVIGPNPSRVPRTVAFALRVTNKTSSVVGDLDVTMFAPVPAATTTVPAATTTVPAATTTVPAATTTVPAATTTVPAATTTVPTTPIVETNSDNWSGYGALGGPYTDVSATFTVPFLTTAAQCDEELSNWVGIDGMAGTPGASELIQAGVNESPSSLQNGQCTSGTFYTAVWWEILPASETLITNWDDGSPAIVKAGDQMTIAIWEVGTATWDIRVSDDTTGEGYTTQQSYDGPGSSAEWIVEAPVDPEVCGLGVGSNLACVMAPYSNPSGNQPGVTFSNLGLTPSTVNTWYQLTTVQNNATVSSPGTLTTSGNNVTGFTVSYDGELSARENTLRGGRPQVVGYQGTAIRALIGPIFNG